MTPKRIIAILQNAQHSLPLDCLRLSHHIGCSVFSPSSPLLYICLFAGIGVAALIPGNDGISVGQRAYASPASSSIIALYSVAPTTMDRAWRDHVSALQPMPVPSSPLQLTNKSEREV